MLKLGIVGGGMYGSRLTRIFSDADRAGLVRFSAIADINRSVLNEMTGRYGIAGYADYKEMIEREKLDAIAVVTPDHLHREIAVYAAEQGLHMLVQKPLDVTSCGAQSIVAAAEKNNILLYVDFHKRFDPGFIMARRQFQNGVYGELLYGYLSIEDTLYIPADAFGIWAHLSSPVWFLGIHVIDVINWVLGEAPVKISSFGMKKKLAGMGIDAYDAVTSRLIYKNGAVITIDTSWILPKTFPSPVNQNVRLVGTDGIIEIDGQDRGVQYWSDNDVNPMNSYINNPYGYLESHNYFTDCGLSGYTIDSVLYFIKLLQKIDSGATVGSLAGTYPTGGEAALATRIAEAIHQSVESGETVEV